MASQTTPALQISSKTEYLGQYYRTLTPKCGEHRADHAGCSNPWTSIKCQMLRPLISCFTSSFDCECPHKFKRTPFQAFTAAQLLTTTRIACAVHPEAAELQAVLELGTSIPAMTRTKEHHTAGHRQNNSSHELSSCLLWGQTSQTFSNHINMPHSVHHLQCLKYFTFLCRARPWSLCSDKADSTQALKP